MKQTLMILICVLTFSAFGQKTKEITKKYKNPFYTEKYSVLNSDKKIKHGNFKKLGYEDCLVIDGYYVHNKKDSLWTHYYWRSKQIKKQGKYKDDKRVGKWNFYSSDGTLLQTYNYKNQELVYPITLSKKSAVIENEQEIKKIFQSSPQFIGSSIELYEYITPSQMEMGNNGDYILKTGTVKISFFVTIDGKAINHKVESGISDKIDQKCLEIVTSIPDLWIPATDENGNVAAQYMIPIGFRIN